MGCLCFSLLVIPDVGQWYSSNSYHREQVAALLRGELSLSHNPSDLAMDLAWSGGGVQQVWGLGVSLWRLPFDLLARAFGHPFFPDRLSLGFLLMLTAFVVLKTWGQIHCRWLSTWCIIFLILCASPLINVLRSSMCQYEEVLVYVYCFATMLGCGVFALAQNPSWKRFLFISAMAGVGGLIRPTLVFYGMSTIVIASLLMLLHETITKKRPCLRPAICGIACGLLLFTAGGGILYLTNLLRFGNGFEFGHSLNVSSALTSVYSTRFDYPFKHLPITETAPELFGALFLLNHFNGVGWYDQGIFMGQSNEIRWRGFDLNTYDLIYAIFIFTAWLFALQVIWKQIKTKPCHFTFAGKEDEKAPSILIVWSLFASIPLCYFYLISPAIAARYMLDFAPAFITAIAALLYIVFSRINGLHYARTLTWIICAFIIGWQIVKISSGKSGFGPPRSITSEYVNVQHETTQPSQKPLSNAYNTNMDLATFGIPFNGEGWGKDGSAWCCSAFYVESPEFVQLELTLASGRSLNEAPPEQLQAKVGLEQLTRTSINLINNTYFVRFAGPKRKRYQHGLQPLFIAWVPAKTLSKYVITPSPWILHEIRWKTKQL